MSSTAFLQSFCLVGPTGAGPRRVEGEIGEQWGIRFAQGGIVMAGMLRAADLVLGRGDVRLVTATATFCRPVPCGRVHVDVEVLRNGRNGVQLQATLRVVGDDDPAPNAIASLVYTTEASGWPEIRGISRPVELMDPPDSRSGAPRFGAGGADAPASPFFEQTDWRLVAQPAEEPLRRLAWFSFVDGPARREDGSWDPVLLAVPGDALGMAVVGVVSDVMGRLTAPSLQISMQVFAPAVGDWLGIDSRCFDTHGALAAGVTTLWNADGRLVASVSQTAMMRPIPGVS
jgi:acyl-CoA thioesterase